MSSCRRASQVDVDPALARNELCIAQIVLHTKASHREPKKHYLGARLADDQPGDLIYRHALHLHTNRSVRVLCARPRMRCNDVFAGLQRTFQANICQTCTPSTERRMSPGEMPPHAYDAEPSTRAFTMHGAM